MLFGCHFRLQLLLLLITVQPVPCDNTSPARVPWVPEVFFSLGETELNGEAAKASRKTASTTSTTADKHYCRQALVALTLLAADEREDLWHPGYYTCHFRREIFFHIWTTKKCPEVEISRSVLFYRKLISFEFCLRE